MTPVSEGHSPLSWYIAYMTFNVDSDAWYLMFPLTDAFFLFVFTISFKHSKKEEWWDVLMDLSLFKILLGNERENTAIH